MADETNTPVGAPSREAVESMREGKSADEIQSMLETAQKGRAGEQPIQQTPAEPQTDTKSEDSHAEQKKYAGKYTSPEELEKAYQNLEKKLGDTDSFEIGRTLLEQVMEKNPDLSREQAVEAVKNYLTGKAELPEEEPVKEKRNPKVDRLADYAEERQFLDTNPDKKELIPLLKEFSTHPAYRNKTLLEIYESPRFMATRELFEAQSVPQAMSVQGSQPSTIQQSIPTVEQLVGMKADDIAKYIPRVATPY